MSEEPLEIDEPKDESAQDDLNRKQLLERFAKEMAKMINKLVLESCLGYHFKDRKQHITINMRNEETVQLFFDEGLNMISRTNKFKDCIHNLMKILVHITFLIIGDTIFGIPVRFLFNLEERVHMIVEQFIRSLREMPHFVHT